MSNKKAILVTGFQNWGKTVLLRNLISGTSNEQFRCGFEHYKVVESWRFGIQQQSNDDVGIDDLIQKVKKRALHNDNLLIAFCPTRENNNDSKKLIEFLEKNGFKIHFLLLLSKWDNHAKLNPPAIKSYFSNSNIEYHQIDSSFDSDKALEVIKLIMKSKHH